MISAVSPRGQMRFMYIDGKQTARVFIDFLKRLIEKAKTPIFLVEDGYPVHRRLQSADLLPRHKDVFGFFICRHTHLT